MGPKVQLNYKVIFINKYYTWLIQPYCLRTRVTSSISYVKSKTKRLSPILWIFLRLLRWFKTQTKFGILINCECWLLSLSIANSQSRQKLVWPQIKYRKTTHQIWWWFKKFIHHQLKLCSRFFYEKLFLSTSWQ